MTRELESLRPSWPVVELGDFPGVEHIAYGIARPRKSPYGVPMIGAKEIIGGVIRAQAPTYVDPEVARRHPRSMLRAGDLLVVAVGRVGETALATEEHQGWNVARSVLVIRWTPESRTQQWDLWLRWWLRTQQSRDYLTVSSSNSEHVTLPLQALSRLPVPVPPPSERERLLRAISHAEQQHALSTRIEDCATELADTYFVKTLDDYGRGPTNERAVGDVGLIVTGTVPSPPNGEQVTYPFVSPAEVLNSRSVFLDATAAGTVAQPDAVCPPGTLLIAPRLGEVRTVLTAVPVVAGPRTLAIRTESDADRMWLLHLLRHRSRELVAMAQGAQARAMRRKDFSRYKISWPDVAVRQEFATRAVALHDLARAAGKESCVMEDLVLHEMSQGGSRPIDVSHEVL
ncbi:hypothetical protein ACFWA4_23040 [Streptomyces sp. NPDC060011]|uniref:hypothetical protein n=1 Tax=unclassified Streptomyces TaxID=2593676 RepID=UPI00369E5266